MIVVFDGAQLPYSGYWPGLVALAALAGCFGWRLLGRTIKWYIPVVIAIVGVFAGGVPLWDQHRVRARVANGEGIEVTRGTIAQTWSITERRRDFSGSGSSIKYKTVVSQGFDVGETRFSWVRGSCLSAASLCNLALTSIPLVRGMEVEVHWFVDPAQGEERRVVRLLARPLGT